MLWLLGFAAAVGVVFLAVKLSEMYRRLKREEEAHRAQQEALVAEHAQQQAAALLNLDRSHDFTLAALGDALDLKDPQTEGHSKRVTAFVIAMSRAMQLSEQQIRVIARGAFLHDIGKMGIPDSILRKPGRLTGDEMVIMREFCYHGYQILSRIPSLAEAAEIVYAHQERYDGLGYPRGIKGDEIPLGARLVAVASTLEAIIFDRPYRHAQTIEAARKEIKLASGRQFDPQIVKVFLELPDRLWRDLLKDIEG